MHTLLKLLEDGEFHSGQDLGSALGVSRSAVWKRLQQMEATLGLEIHRVRGRGYRLARPLSLLNDARLAIEGMPDGWHVHLYSVLDSTNAQGMRLIGEGGGLPLLVLSEQQTAGRGRRGRKWVSPFAENLYYSLVLRIDGGMRQLEGLSLLVGLAVMKTMREEGIESAGLKWPNDILVGREKLAGILLELTGDPADVCHVVIGIGININMRGTVEIDQAWTSMQMQLGVVVDRNRIVARLSKHLDTYLKRQKEEGFEAFQEEWERAHLWQGLRVALLAGLKTIEGTVLGVDAVGAIRLDVEGVEQSYSGGELSLRLSEAYSLS